jgi:N-acetylglucosamine transport system substrate-binding protein
VRKKGKFSVLVILCMMLVISLAACSSKNETEKATETSKESTNESSTPAATEAAVYPENGLPKDQKVTLKFAVWESGMGREYIDYAMETFKKKFPNVSFDVMYSPAISTVVTTKVAANDDKDMFDIFMAEPTGGLLPLVKEGKLESQEDLWDHKVYDGNGKTVKELTMDGVFEGSPRIQNKTYTLPIAVTSGGMFFDKNLFKKYGWNTNPKTWDEFLQLCEDIKSQGIIPITYPGVYSFYLANGLTGPWKLFELAEQYGNLEKFQDDFRNIKLPQWTATENIELWSRMYEMGKRGYFPAGVAALNHTQSQMQVLQGKAAMVTTGIWVENEMKDAAPKGFEWGFLSVPMGDDPNSTKWIQLSATTGILIWANKPELTKKWAKEFSVWLWNMDVQESIAEFAGSLPIRKDFSDDQARVDKLQGAPREMLAYAKRNNIKFESGFRNVRLTDPANAQAAKMFDEITNLITTGKKDPIPVLIEGEKLIKKAIEAQKKQ